MKNVTPGSLAVADARFGNFVAVPPPVRATLEFCLVSRGRPQKDYLRVA